MATPTAGTLVLVALCVVAGCGTDAVGPEVVVADAAMGSGAVTVLGAKRGTVYWSVQPTNGPKRIAGSLLATLPAPAEDLGNASGPVVQVDDHLLILNDDTIVRTGVGMTASKIQTTMADTLGESSDRKPSVVWTSGSTVSWSTSGQPASATIAKTIRCDRVLVTTNDIFVAVEGTAERRLVRVDRTTGVQFGLTASQRFEPRFPNGDTDGAEYRGRLVGANDAGAAWLVEEIAAGASSTSRAILISVPRDGEPTPVLEHIGAVSAFFVTDDAYYWQEADALLTAPLAGGPATIVATLPAEAGAVADGFVYYATGTTIERLALD